MQRASKLVNVGNFLEKHLDEMLEIEFIWIQFHILKNLINYKLDLLFEATYIFVDKKKTIIELKLLFNSNISLPAVIIGSLGFFYLNTNNESRSEQFVESRWGETTCGESVLVYKTFRTISSFVGI